MICFLDRSFCSDVPECANAEGCPSHFSDSYYQAAIKWWGSEHAPVAFESKKETCKKWEEKK